MIEDSRFESNGLPNSGTGGAVESTNRVGTGVLLRSEFVDNNGWSGGAIYLGGSTRIESSLFESNGAEFRGGAIRSLGSLDITDSDFTLNSAGNRGGAIEAFQGFGTGAATMTIDDCRFDFNFASQAGAIDSRVSALIVDSSFTTNWGTAVVLTRESDVVDSFFMSNSSAQSGGAIRGPVNITGTAFSSNFASDGGGAVAGVMAISASSFVANTTNGSGGAVAGAEAIEDSVFTGNGSTLRGTAAVDFRRGSRLTATGNFSLNSSFMQGGALSGFDLLEESTVAGNRAAGVPANLVLCDGSRVVRCRVAVGPVPPGMAGPPPLGLAVQVENGAVAVIEDSLIEGGVQVREFGSLDLVGCTVVGQDPDVPALDVERGGLAVLESSILAGDTVARASSGSGLLLLSSLVEGGLGEEQIASNVLVDVVGILLTFDPGFVDADGPDNNPLTFDDNDLRPRHAS
ncbi:MAG: hypothetical protein AAF658_16040, partial [Myxococcota bacterium]